MNTQNTTRLSKFLSLILRHKPQLIGLELDTQGWADTDDLLNKCNQFGKKLDKETLLHIVASDNKKRYSFNEDGSKIRASQGHSIKVELGYVPQIPPKFLYHGTATRFVDSIMEKGLIKGNRHHVHLSAEQETAIKVGSRHGKPIVLIIKAQEMQEGGQQFFRSENGVWLTEHVPARFIEKMSG